MKKEAIIAKLKTEQAAWFRIYNLARSRLIALDAWMKSYRKKKQKKKNE